MASIPVFNSPVGTTVQQTASPVQSLDSVIRAQVMGYEVGLKVPNTASAIAQGLTNAVKTYEDIQSTNIEQESARLSNERNAIINQQLQEDQAAIGTADSELKAAQINQELETLNKRQEILGILGSEDPDAITDAFTNPGNADVFSDPNFAKAAFQRAAPYLPKAVMDGFLSGERTRQKQDYLTKFKEKTQEDFLKAEQTFMGSELLADIKDKNPDLDVHDIIRGTDIVPSNKYEVNDDGSYKRDPDTGKLVEAQFDPEAQESKFVDIVDRKTKKILMRGVPKSQVNDSGFTKYRSLANYHDDSLVDGTVASVVKRLNGENPSTKESTATGSVSTRLDEQPVGQQTAEQPEPLPKVNNAPDYTGAKKSLSNVSLTTPQGKIQTVGNENARAVLGKAIGVPDIDAYSKDLDVLLQNAEGFNPVFFTPEAKAKRFNEVNEAKDRLISASLKNTFNNNIQTYASKYNDDAVEFHNSRVKGANQMLALGEAGDLLAFLNDKNQPFAALDASQLIEVDSPEELFVLQNYDKASSTIDSFLSDMRQQAAQQSQATFRRTAANKTALATLRKFK